MSTITPERQPLRQHQSSAGLGSEAGTFAGIACLLGIVAVICISVGVTQEDQKLKWIGIICAVAALAFAVFTGVELRRSCIVPTA